MHPTGTDPHHWNAYMRSARTAAEATSRVAQAVTAGVDFEAMLTVKPCRSARTEDWSWPSL